jgi:hypothetical protein
MDGFGNWDGPAVAAVVSEGAARFTADPRRRDGAGLHLDVRTFPDDGVEFPRGVLSADQQREDLLHLAALRNASTPIPEGEAAVANPADKLAAWLLRQAMPSGG